MFLVTTANQNFWKTDDPILFLGEWCRVYSQKHIWSELSDTVLPFHGRDREQLFRDYQYSMDVYERVLDQLSKELNKLHGLNYSSRYWRIIIGPWLSYFVEVFLDRYRSICIAADSGKVTNTWITTEFKGQYLPNDMNEFRDRCKGDDYNHYLFSVIIKYLGTIPWEAKQNVDFLNFEYKPAIASQDKDFKSTMIRLVGACSRFVPDSLRKVVAIQSYIKPIDLMKLQLSMKMFPCLYGPEIDTVASKVDWAMRQNIRLDQRKNSFESILEECIPLHIPKVYIEGYTDMVQRVMKVYPKNIKVILTSNAYKGNEGFKFWAASQVDRGVKLGITQHGGHVGDALWSTDDDHEIKISDRYFSWGWTQNNESKVVPTPSSMLSRAKNCKPDPNGSILCVSSTSPRYPYLMFSFPNGPLVLESFKLQRKFSHMVSSPVLSHLVFRLAEESGWEERLRWLDSDRLPHIYQGNMSYYNHLARSRLCVCFYNGTPFLETFVANFPTILCWDPRYTELNASAQPYFNLLKNVGILHETPESAASKLNKIYQNPLSWWVSPKVQDAKNKFCDRFARTGNDWKAQWQGELSKLICE
jgi:putative transferase (TIGR04331 family)